MGTSRVSIFSFDAIPLDPSFFDRDTLSVARELLGKMLVRTIDGQRLAGIITETEAYNGEADLGCHAKCGRTRRNEVMYGPPGQAYVYFTYGMHWCLNCVTREEGFPAAVLLRAIHPVHGEEFMRVHRNKDNERHLTDGPAKLCQALRVDGALNGHVLCDPKNELSITQGLKIPDELTMLSARIGLNNVPEPWRSLPWRFQIDRLETLL